MIPILAVSYICQDVYGSAYKRRHSPTFDEDFRTPARVKYLRRDSFRKGELPQVTPKRDDYIDFVRFLEGRCADPAFAVRAYSSRICRQIQMSRVLGIDPTVDDSPGFIAGVLELMKSSHELQLASDELAAADCLLSLSSSHSASSLIGSFKPLSLDSEFEKTTMSDTGSDVEPELQDFPSPSALSTSVSWTFPVSMSDDEVDSALADFSAPEFEYGLLGDINLDGLSGSNPSDDRKPLHSALQLLTDPFMASQNKFLSNFDISMILLKRLLEVSSIADFEFTRMKNSARLTSTEEIMNHFIWYNTAELRPIVDDVSSFDVVLLSAANANHPKLVAMRKVFEDYAPHCGHISFKGMPPNLRPGHVEVFRPHLDTSFNQVVRTGPSFRRIRASLEKFGHSVYSIVRAVEQPYLESPEMISAETLDSSRAVCMDGFGLFAVRDDLDSPWYLLNMVTGGSVSMGGYTPSTFRFIPHYRIVFRVQSGALFLNSAFRQLPIVLARHADIVISDVSMSMHQGELYLLAEVGGRQIVWKISAKGDEPPVVIKVPGIYSEYVLDGDVVHVIRNEDNAAVAIPMAPGGTGEGSYPTVRVRSDMRIYEYIPETRPKGRLYMLVDSAKSRVHQDFVQFCVDRDDLVFIARERNTESRILFRICQALTAVEGQGELAQFAAMEELIGEHPFSSHSIRDFLLSIVSDPI